MTTTAPPRSLVGDRARRARDLPGVEVLGRLAHEVKGATVFEGVETSRPERMLPVPPLPVLLGDATRLSRLTTAGVVATNVGAGSQVIQTVVDPDWRSGGNPNLATDLVQRRR